MQNERDMKTSRINTGIYKIVKGDKTFEARKNEYHGQWELFEMKEVLNGEEWIETYLDLRSCKIHVERFI